jgi:signal transduction histidine kinase
MWLTLAQLALLGIVFVMSLFMSHKIAGPMYKLKNHITNLRSGRKYDHLFFRKGDNFPEIADEFNQFVDHLKAQHAHDTEYLSEVSSYINNLSLVVPEDKKPVIKEILSKIAEMQNRFSN